MLRPEATDHVRHGLPRKQDTGDDLGDDVAHGRLYVSSQEFSNSNSSRDGASELHAP